MGISSPNRALLFNTLKQQINLLYVDSIVTLTLIETFPRLPSGLGCRNFSIGAKEALMERIEREAL